MRFFSKALLVFENVSRMLKKRGWTISRIRLMVYDKVLFESEKLECLKKLGAACFVGGVYR